MTNNSIDPRDEFLALIIGGSTPQEAAHMMGTTTAHFRKLRNPLSPKYDKEFAEDYEDLMEACRKLEVERIRGAVLCRHLGHNYEPTGQDGPLICARCGILETSRRT